MKFPRIVMPFAAFAILLSAFPALAADDYQPGPDSKPQPGVPKGAMPKFTLENSKFFPGPRYDYRIDLQQKGSPDKPACVFVGQDGIGLNAPVVFDNLIAKKEMLVTIGVFVKPGIVPAADTNAALDRFNRSYEYDGLDRKSTRL